MACTPSRVLQDMTTRLWDLRYPAASFALLKAHIGAIRSLRFRHGGSRDEGWRGLTQLLPACSWTLCACIRSAGPYLCLCSCSPAGRFLAASEPADYVTIYDAASGWVMRGLAAARAMRACVLHVRMSTMVASLPTSATLHPSRSTATARARWLTCSASWRAFHSLPRATDCSFPSRASGWVQ